MNKERAAQLERAALDKEKERSESQRLDEEMLKDAEKVPITFLRLAY